MSIKGKIYVLWNTVDTLKYVGSTTYPLMKRLSSHLSASKFHAKDNKVYKHLNMIGWDNVRMSLVDEHDFKTKGEMLMRERFWMEFFHATLNTQLPSHSPEYYVYNYFYNMSYTIPNIILNPPLVLHRAVNMF